MRGMPEAVNDNNKKHKCIIKYETVMTKYSYGVILSFLSHLHNPARNFSASEQYVLSRELYKCTYRKHVYSAHAMIRMQIQIHGRRPSTQY